MFKKLRGWLLLISSLWVITAGCSASLPAQTRMTPTLTSVLTRLPISRASATITPSLTVFTTWTPALTLTSISINTPKPTATTTTTLSSEFSSLKIVYADQGKLWLWQNYISKSLTTADEYTTVSISPSGTQLAFMRDGALMVINMDGTNEKVLVSREEMNILLEDSMYYYYLCDWINDAYLVFYTFVNGEIGRFSRNDLYLVNVQSGEWQTIFAPGTGGMVYVSPDRAYIAVVSHTSIRLMDYDGSNQRTVLTYEHVLYATDVPWYPKMVWSANSSSLIVSVSSANAPNNPLEPATIWLVPVEGAPTIIAQTARDLNPLFSPDFSKYVALSNTTGLNVFDIDGANEQLYSNNHIYWMDWLPDSSGFVYYDTTENAIMIGSVSGRSPSEAAFLEEIYWPWIEWFDAHHYILQLQMYSNDHQQIWTDLWFGTVGEAPIKVITNITPGDIGCFDFVRE